MPLPYYATPGTHTIGASTIKRADELKPADTIHVGDRWEVVTGTIIGGSDTSLIFDGGGFEYVPNGTLYHVSDVVELHQYVATITHPFYPDGMELTVMAPYYRRAMSLVCDGVKGVDAENWKNTVGGLSIGDEHFTVPGNHV